MGKEAFLRTASGWRSLLDGHIETDPAQGLAHNWSDSNVPWAYESTSEFTEDWPAATIIDIPTTSSSFYTNIMSACDNAGHRVVLRLGEGTYHLTDFHMIGDSNDPNYSFGFWHPYLQGFLGQGPDKTIIQMDADSMDQAQLDSLKTIPYGPTGKPNMLHFGRLDGKDASSPVLLAGVTLRGCDQQMLSGVDSSVPSVQPQSAPYAGLQLFSGAYGQLSHVRFQAAGRAWTSQPPFEHGNLDTQKGSITYNKVEFDGRLAPEINAARPRRCGPYMGNNEALAEHNDVWMHHSNVSRYAVNDQNYETSGVYTLRRCKIEQITNTKNDGNGGYSNASLVGYESSNATVNVQDCILSVDNPYVESSQGRSHHLQFTTVTRNPQGGRLHVSGSNVWASTGFPDIDGYLTVRVAPTSIYWRTDGYANTMDIKNADGDQMTAYVYSGTWPPTRAALEGAGIHQDTHYIVREN